MGLPTAHIKLPDSEWRDITALCTSDWLDLSVRFRYKGGRCTLDARATTPVSPGLRIVGSITGLSGFGWALDNMHRGTWISEAGNQNGVARNWGTSIIMYGTIPAGQRLSAVIEWWGTELPPAWPGVPVP